MSGVVNVFVVSADTHSERRIDPHNTVEQLKGKLELITGVPAANQALTLLASELDPRVIATLDDDSKKLGFYGIADWQVLKVVDTNPSSSLTGQLTDVTQVDKFEITEAEYAQRRDTVLAFKQRNKLGRFGEREASAEPEPAPESYDIPVGARCEIESLEPGLSKRGAVRFIGPTKFGKGIWVGVQYDEPFGKNDGSVQGERYFTCPPNYGVFVKPEKVKVGDYPVEELDVDMGEDEEM
ncbi:tubulin-folding cofactor B [Pholiota molesta]|nr:tubulin-folding cofactor B [Pholiota molesta]